MMNERCEHCPVAEGSPCPGTKAPGICREAAPGAPDRERWVAKLLGLKAPVPVVWRRGPALPPETNLEPTGKAKTTIRDVIACDYRIPLARLRNEGSDGYSDCGCGYSAKCMAGKSDRKDGSVGRVCFSCPLAGSTH